MRQTGFGIQPVLWDTGTVAQKTPAPVETQARETQKPWLPPLSAADNKPSGTTGNKESGQTDTAVGKQPHVPPANEGWQNRAPGEIRNLLNVFDAKSVIGLGVDGLDYDKLLQMAYDGKIKITDPGEKQKLTVSWADGWSAKGYKQQPWELAAPKRAKVSASGDDILQTEIHGGQQEYGFVLPKRNTLKDPGYRIVPGSEEQRALVDTYIVGKTGDAEKAGELARFWEEENKQRSFGIYAKYLGDPEYAAYALQGAAIQNPDYYHAVGGTDEIGNIVTFSLDNADFIRNRVATVGSETVDNRDGSVLLLYMNGTEVDMYNYLLIKEGSEAAQEYLRHIENTLKMRHGQAKAQTIQDMKGEHWWENIDYVVHSGALGFASGLDSAVNGFEQLFTEEKIEPGSLQYANYYFSKELEGIDKVAYGIANQVGNMTPMILTTAVATALGVPPAVTAALGSATVGLSATGNAYTSALERGCSKEHAKLYAISVGASEAGFQYLLGGIGAFGGIAADDLLVKVAALDNALYRFAGAAAVKGGAEAIEENLQNFIEPLLRTMMLGEEYDLPTWEEIAYTSLVSFFTADLLEGGEIAAVTSLGIDAYSDAGADYASLAERVIANAEKTVLGEAQLQSNLERGILEAEQQYLAAVEEVQRETGISVGDRSSGEHNAQQSAASYRTTVGTEQTAMSVAQDGGETSTPNTELWVQQYQAEVERAEREKQQSLTESTSVIGANASVLTNETEEISEAVRAMLLQYEVETVQAELMAEEALSNAHKTREQLADEGADRLLAGQMPTDEQLLAMGKSHARALGDLAVLQMNALDDTWDTTSVHQVLSGHSGTPKKADPNTVVDHVNADGNVDSRGFYNRFGMKAKDLHTTNHGYPKQHAYGEHGEHIHEYEWDDEGRLKNKTTRDLTDEERERNGDIL